MLLLTRRVIERATLSSYQCAFLSSYFEVTWYTVEKIGDRMTLWSNNTTEEMIYVVNLEEQGSRIKIRANFEIYIF